MAQIEWTPEARQSIKQIGRYIATQSGSIETAERVLRRIEAKCEQYARQPLMGESRPDLGETVRNFPAGNYIVFYEPLGDDGIRLLLAIHGARDVVQVFRDLFDGPTTG